MILEFTVAGDAATGRIAELGTAEKYGYKKGEDIIRVKVNDFGEWSGELHWRSVSGADRWDHIYLVATDRELKATQTTDDCYKSMSRAH